MNFKRANLVGLGLVIAVTLIHPGGASAAEIKVLCSNAMESVMKELVPRFEQATGHKVVITFGLSAELMRQVAAEESFDIAVLTPTLIDAAINQGKIAGNTRVIVGRSPIALAIRTGAPKPDIRTMEALRGALLSVKSIAYAKEGASGVFFSDFLQRFGLADSLNSKVKLTTTGSEVAASVASGDAELGVLPVSEILPVRGIEVVGTFPADLQAYVTLVAGVSTSSTRAQIAQDMIEFLTAPATAPVLKAHGMERF